MIWKVSKIICTQSRDWFLISNWLSKTWIWVNNKGSFNATIMFQWEKTITKRRGKIFGSRWNRCVDVVMQRSNLMFTLYYRKTIYVLVMISRCRKEIQVENRMLMWHLMNILFHNLAFHQQKRLRVNSRLVLDITRKELISDADFRSSRFAEVDCSSIFLFCRVGVVCFPQNVASIDFQCL